MDILGVVAATLAAALAPAVILAAADGNLDIMTPVFGVALGHVVIFGLPLLLIFRKRVNVWSTVIVAFIVGVVPAAVMFWPGDSDGSFSASIGGVPTVIAGIPTVAGWLNYLGLLAFLGACGAVSGLAFWLVLKFTGCLPSSDRTAIARG